MYMKGFVSDRAFNEIMGKSSRKLELAKKKIMG